MERCLEKGILRQRMTKILRDGNFRDACRSKLGHLEDGMKDGMKDLVVV